MAWRTRSALLSDKIWARREGRIWETCCTMNTAAPKWEGRSETIVLIGCKLPADPPITTILMLPDAIYALLEGGILSPPLPVPAKALLLFLHCVPIPARGPI